MEIPTDFLVSKKLNWIHENIFLCGLRHFCCKNSVSNNEFVKILTEIWQ